MSRFSSSFYQRVKQKTSVGKKARDCGERFRFGAGDTLARSGPQHLLAPVGGPTAGVAQSYEAS